MSQTYLTTDELSSRIKYDARTIRERMKDSVLLEGCITSVHLVAERFFILALFALLTFP